MPSVIKAKLTKLIFTVFALLLVVLIAQQLSSKEKLPFTYSTISFNDNTFDIVKINPEATSLTSYWKNTEGQKFKSFENLQNWLKQSESTLLFATNAGIYTEEFAPLGLYIENSKELTSLNHNDGEGNFYLKPNGVFYIDEYNRPDVKETTTFANSDISARLATQSGPLLLSNYQINTAFNPDSKNKYIRNGVCTTPNDQIVFAISNNPVTFYDFASLFKEELSCKDALYLDGTISKMYVSGKRNQLDGDFAAIIAISTP